jgi:integrase
MDAVELYVRDVLEGGQRRPSTITDARNVFGHFARWREEASKGAPETLTRADLREFKSWLLERFHTNTARKCWVRVGALYHYLLVEDAIDRDPTLGIELPKLKQRPPRVYTTKDIRQMVEACQSNLDRVVLYAFVFTGMRESEVKALAWRPAPADEDDVRSYVDLDADAIVITSAKQDKSRAVPLHPLLRAELAAAQNDPVVWAEGGGVNVDGDWLFPERQLVVRVMRRLLKASSTPGCEHQFRATMLTWMDENGVSDSVRHAIAGHAAKGIEAKHYLAVKDERKIAAVRSLYAGELPGCEGLVVPSDTAGLDLDGLTATQRAAVESMIEAFKAA